MLDDSALPPVIAAVHSLRWESMLKKNAASVRQLRSIAWQPDIEKAVCAGRRSPHSVVIAELSRNFCDVPASVVELTCRACNDPQGLKLFFLGDERHQRWRKILCQAGAVDTCFSMLDFSDFWGRIRRHLMRHARNHLSVEEMIESIV